MRAAGAVLGVEEVLVIGSQALHASSDASLPEEAVRSVDVDVAVPCAALLRAGLLDRELLRERLQQVGDISPELRTLVEGRIAR